MFELSAQTLTVFAGRREDGRPKRSSILLRDDLREGQVRHRDQRFPRAPLPLRDDRSLLPEEDFRGCRKQDEERGESVPGSRWGQHLPHFPRGSGHLDANLFRVLQGHVGESKQQSSAAASKGMSDTE